MAIFPENTDEDVTRILDHIGVSKEERDKVIFLEPKSNLDEKKASSLKYPFSQPYKLFDVVKRFIDLKGMVAKKTIKNFADYC